MLRNELYMALAHLILSGKKPKNFSGHRSAMRSNRSAVTYTNKFSGKEQTKTKAVICATQELWKICNDLIEMGIFERESWRAQDVFTVFEHDDKQTTQVISRV